MSSLKSLNLSLNLLFHMAVTPKFLKQEDMWVITVDPASGKDLYVNAITKEKIFDIAMYDGKGIQKMASLHKYQPKNAVLAYRKRKMWLSICKVLLRIKNLFSYIYNFYCRIYIGSGVGAC